MTALILLVWFSFLPTILFISTHEFSQFLSSYSLPCPTAGAKLTAKVKTLSLG